MGAIFGKPAKSKQSSTSTSTSGNANNDAIMSAFGPVMGYTSQAGGLINSLLGIGGPSSGSGVPQVNPGYSGQLPGGPTTGPAVGSGGPLSTIFNRTFDIANGNPDSFGSVRAYRAAQGLPPLGGGGASAPAPAPASAPGPAPAQAPTDPNPQMTALDNFANSGGMSWLRDQGNKQINANQSARGLFNSGSTGMALQKYGQGLGSTFMNQFLQNALEQERIGLGAGGLVSGAGQQSSSSGSSTGTSTGAKQGVLGDLIAAGSKFIPASDPRLKTDIEKIGDEHGVGLYKFRYKQDMGVKLPKGQFIGYMADEVQEKFPDAIGPSLKGYLTIGDKRFFPRKVGD